MTNRNSIRKNSPRTKTMEDVSGNNPPNKKFLVRGLIFLSFFLINFLVALEITGVRSIAPQIADFFAIPENISHWITDSYIYAIFITTFVFLLIADIFGKKEGIRKFFIEGVIYFMLGSFICYFANDYNLFVFGRIIQGLGAGIALLAQARLARYLSTQNLRTMTLCAVAGIAGGAVFGNYLKIPEMLSRGFQFIFIFSALGSAGSLIVISEKFNTFFAFSHDKIVQTNAINIFFGTHKQTEVKKKAIGIALLFPTYWVAEYFLAGLTFALVVLLKYHGFGGLFIFFVLWPINIVLSGLTIFLNDWSGIDFTTMEGRRRWFKALIKKLSLSGKIVAVIFEIAYSVFLIVWDGADWFMLFFRDRLRSRFQRITAFFLATAVQMAIWTAVYSFGYESVEELIKRFIW